MQSLILLFILFFQWLSPKKEPKVFRISGYAQGTTYQVTYYAPEQRVTKEMLDQLLVRVDSSLSIYKPYSLISQFNASKQGVKMDRLLREVVITSLNVYKETGGKFDITVYPLVRAWGFGTQKIKTLPDSAEIKSLLTCVGSDKIRIKGDSLIKTNSNTKIDVNGIAQGYTVDLLAALLEQFSISAYLVELGGEIRVKGPKPDGQAMRVGIESPTKNLYDDTFLQKVLEVKKGAVTTSGTYRKFIEAGNKRITHLINPKTGYYLSTQMISATVYAKSAMTADAYDNALMAMNPAEAIAFVTRHKGLEAYLIYQKEDGSVADTASKGFYKLVRRN